jgi:hypothetical protein
MLISPGVAGRDSRRAPEPQNLELKLTKPSMMEFRSLR